MRYCFLCLMFFIQSLPLYATESDRPDIYAQYISSASATNFNIGTYLFKPITEQYIATLDIKLTGIQSKKSNTSSTIARADVELIYINPLKGKISAKYGYGHIFQPSSSTNKTSSLYKLYSALYINNITVGYLQSYSFTEVSSLTTQQVANIFGIWEISKITNASISIGSNTTNANYTLVSMGYSPENLSDSTYLNLGFTNGSNSNSANITAVYYFDNQVSFMERDRNSHKYKYSKSILLAYTAGSTENTLNLIGTYTF